MMTDEQIDAIAASMPDGEGGMLRKWGYRQFARAVADHVAEQKWPTLSDLHLQALMFAYNEGYSKAIDGRKFKNPFSPEGSQAAAWALGTADGAEARGKMASAPVALPAGYALVPIEPTPEMIEAGATERITPHASAGHGAVAGYKAMLAAAPVASAPVAGEAQRPVAWANWKVGTDSYVPYRTREAAQASVNQSSIAATQEGPYHVVALVPAAPQASEASIPGMREAARLLRERASDLENCICAHDSKADARALRTAAHHLRRVARHLQQTTYRLDTGPTEPDNGGD